MSLLHCVTSVSIARRLAPIILVVLGACSAAPPLPEGAKSDELKPTPVSDNPKVLHGEANFRAADGLRLFRQVWRPVAKPKGVLVLVHGLKDHGARYASLAEMLALQGFIVHAADLRGHGRSGGERVRIDVFDEYLTDLGTLFRLVRAEDPGLPVFLMGHSMGGAIATLYSLDNQTQLQGLVLSAPALKITDDVSGFLIGVTKFMSALFPGAAVFGLDEEKFSRDPKVIADMRADPLVYQPKGAARTAAELLKALASIQERQGEMALPLLVMHGDKDEITNPDGSKGLIAKAKSKDKTLKIYGGMFHDLLHEPEKAEVKADIALWLDAHANGLPQAATPTGK